MKGALDNYEYQARFLMGSVDWVALQSLFYTVNYLCAVWKVFFISLAKQLSSVQ